MELRRMVILTGHYGSGKTSLAVSMALDKRAVGKRVAIADLDIVNPYFRTTDCREQLTANGIELIASLYAGSNVDLPALPKELYRLAEDTETDAVLDVGGDDRGAVALGRYAPAIARQTDCEILFVVNFFRPLTKTAEEAANVLSEVERASGLRVSAIVHNSNLGKETTAEDVLYKQAEAERMARATGLPIRCTAANKTVIRALAGRIENLYEIEPLSLFSAE